jgi:hypothetical protein
MESLAFRARPLSTERSHPPGYWLPLMVPPYLCFPKLITKDIYWCWEMKGILSFTKAPNKENQLVN